MAKFTKAEREKLIEQAKQLYCKNFDYEQIHDFLDKKVSIATLQVWGIENDFDKVKRARLITLSELRDVLLESFSDVINDKTPKISADQAAKYATAFEKFSDKKKVLMYMYEAFERLTDRAMASIAEAKPTEKKRMLEHLKFMRDVMNIEIDQLSAEVLGS